VSSFAALAEWRDRYPSIGYVAPFAFVVLFIAITPYVPAAASPLAAFWLWPLQVLAGVVVCFLCWPEELSVRPGFRFASIGVGLVVFAIWIAPDVLAPGYRGGILFSNGIMGRPHSSLPLEAQRSAWVLAWRMARATVVVPIAG
jgi:ribosome modulation factor